MTAPAQPHEDDILGKAYDRKLMGRLLVYTRPYRSLMYGAFALLCVEGGIQVVGPLLTRRVIDVAVPTHNLHIVIVSTGLFVLALILIPGVRIVSSMSARDISRHPRAPCSNNRVRPVETVLDARRSALLSGGAGGTELRRAEPLAPRRKSQIDYGICALLPGDRAADVHRARDTDSCRRVARPRKCVERRNGRRLSAAGAKILSATPGSLGEVQHPSDRYGELRANLHPPRH